MVGCDDDGGLEEILGAGGSRTTVDKGDDSGSGLTPGGGDNGGTGSNPGSPPEGGGGVPPAGTLVFGGDPIPEFYNPLPVIYGLTELNEIQFLSINFQLDSNLDIPPNEVGKGWFVIAPTTAPYIFIENAYAANAIQDGWEVIGDNNKKRISVYTELNDDGKIDSINTAGGFKILANEFERVQILRQRMPIVSDEYNREYYKTINLKILKDESIWPKPIEEPENTPPTQFPNKAVNHGLLVLPQNTGKYFELGRSIQFTAYLLNEAGTAGVAENVKWKLNYDHQGHDILTNYGFLTLGKKIYSGWTEKTTYRSSSGKIIVLAYINSEIYGTSVVNWKDLREHPPTMDMEPRDDGFGRLPNDYILPEIYVKKYNVNPDNYRISLKYIGKESEIDLFEANVNYHYGSGGSLIKKNAGDKAFRPGNKYLIRQRQSYSYGPSTWGEYNTQISNISGIIEKPNASSITEIIMSDGKMTSSSAHVSNYGGYMGRVFQVKPSNDIYTIKRDTYIGVPVGHYYKVGPDTGGNTTQWTMTQELYNEIYNNWLKYSKGPDYKIRIVDLSDR
jgi:hypothetical protein